MAGITPAADIVKLMNRPAGTTAPAGTALLPSGMKSEVVASGSATSTEAAAGMRQLALPLSISGVGTTHARQLTEQLTKRLPGSRVYTAGATGAAGGAGSASDIVPGGNFAAAISYGDVSAVATGTTTMICDGKAVAFGHPFFFEGASSMSVHGGNAVYVQADGFVPFKVVNPGGVAGTLDQDRLAGIRGVLGEGPASVPVVAEVSAEGESRTGTTHVNLPDFLPTIAATHVYSNVDRVLDRIGPGSAALSWVVDGKRADGTPFKVEGSNRYASPYDVSYESVGELWDILYSIENNRYEDAHVTGVSVEATASDTFAYETIGSVSVRKPDGTYRKLSYSNPLRVQPGSRLNLRVTLKPYGKVGPTRDVDVPLTVPADKAGASGSLRVTGGASYGYYGYYDEYYSPSGTASFDSLLENLNTVTPGDSFDVGLSLRTYKDKTTTKMTKHQSAPNVVGGGLSIPVYVLAPKAPGAGVVDGSTWKVRPTMTAGKPANTFTYGKATDQVLTGDFDGNGAKSPAVFRDGQWWIKLTNTSTSLVGAKFGQAGDVAVVGDWDGDGRDTIGVYRDGRWLLNNALDSGPADRDFTFGDATMQPVVGDWNGDGFDTVGTFAAGKWSVRNSNNATSPLTTFTYGKAGDIPVVGDWEGDGRDEPGVYRAGVWTVRPNLTSGTGTWFRYGTATSRPVVWG